MILPPLDLISLSHAFMGLPNESVDSRFYRQMFFIRRFEQKILELFDLGILNGTTHACIGQEANCVGVIAALNSDDHVFSNHRCHGHYLAKTGDAIGLLGEIIGKSIGVCGGIGGSQHLCMPDFKSNGVLGGTAAGAAGLAMAYKLKGSRQISGLFLGDGVFGEGAVYEVLNLASLWQLPLFIVVEDNAWAQSTHQKHNLAGKISDRINAFGIRTEEIDSTDVTLIHNRAREMVSFVRDEVKPAALVIHTYRLCHHSKNDDNRPAEEVALHWEKEPLTASRLNLTLSDREALEYAVEVGLDAVIQFVRATP